MSVRDFPESLSQAMLAGVMLVGGLGVPSSLGGRRPVSLDPSSDTPGFPNFLYIQ